MILSPSESRDKGRTIYGGKEITAGSPLKSPSTAKSIDDVWNDISLSSFHHRTTPPAAATTSVVSTHPSTFQDFFAPANPSCPAHSPRFTPPPAATAATVLSLNSAPHSNNIHKNSSSTSQLCNCTEPNITSSIKSTNFHLLPSSSSSSSYSLPMKRPDPEYCEKHKRLMKNRESAARSRARKQARADELELEVERLTKENAMLKRQQQEEKQQVSSNATPARLPKKSRLYRTLTAPF